MAPPKKNAPLTYAGTGVDIDAGDEAVRRIQQHIRRTHGPRVINNPGGFAGLFRLDYNEQLFRRNYRDPVLVACTDGVGSKVLLACELGIHDTVGIDCVAMNVNDLIVQGAEPLLFLDYIGINKVDPAMIERLVAGVAKGCELAGCALVGGETAELPDVYKPGDYDLAGFSLGVVELDRAMDSTRVEPGDVVLGLESDGVHSNGFSLVRKIVSARKLKLSKTYPELDPSRSLGEVLLTPTRIYAQQVVRAQRAYKVKKVITGMAHITGGGLADNLVRSIPNDVNAEIDWSAWGTPSVFRFLAERGGIEQAEMRRVFNMGIGYCLIVRPGFADATAKRLEKMGERVHTIGRITKGTGKVVEKTTRSRRRTPAATASAT